MATFQITGPDGKKYRVSGENAEGAYAALQQHLSDGQESPAYKSALESLSNLTEQKDFTAGSRIEFENLPTWKKPLVAASDIAQVGVAGMTGGLLNSAAAAVRSPFTGNSYSDELQALNASDDRARERSGSAGTASEIMGMVYGMGKASGAGATAGRVIPPSLTGPAGLAARAGASAVDGLAMNELINVGKGNEFGTNAGVSAVLGAAAPVVGSAASALGSKAFGVFNKAAKSMTAQELKAAGEKALEEANSKGVIFTPEGMSRLRDNVVADMADFGYHPVNQPGAAAAIEELNRLASQNVTLKGLHSARKLAQGGFNATNPSNNEAVGRIVSKIDDMISNPAAGDVMTGAGNAADDFNRFKDLYHRGSKLQKVDDLVEKARLQAGSTGSGGNADNATRQKLREILTNGKTGRGFTAEEKSAVEKIVMGTKGQNALRLAGKLSPSGNGLMAALGVGGAMVNPVVGGISLAGMGAKSIADGMTGRNVEALRQLIINGGSKSAAAPVKNALQKLSESKRDAIARMVMGSGFTSLRRSQPSY